MTTVRSWLLASRPATLTAALAPVAVGSACAYALGGFRAGPALAALVGAMLIQIGTNFANDVFDFESGADNDERIGPVRATQSGLITPRQMRVGMGVAFGLSVAVGVYLTWVAGWPVIAIGAASIVAGIAYTGGPYPLGYHGLGDVFVLLFFGFVAVAGTAFVQLGHVPALALWVALPVGALATAILVVNNVRDRDTDARAGKRTLAVRFGRNAGRAEYAVLVGSAYATVIALWLMGETSAWVLLPGLTMPLAIAQLRVVITRTDGPSLNRCLARTAQLLIFYGLLLAIGLVLGKML